VQILVAVEGCGVVEARGRDPVTLAKGDAVVIPAAVQVFTVRPQWQLEFFEGQCAQRDRAGARHATVTACEKIRLQALDLWL